MKLVKNLKGSGLRICTDLPPELNTKRAKLLAKMKDLKASYLFSRLKQAGALLRLEHRNNDNEYWSEIFISDDDESVLINNT